MRRASSHSDDRRRPRAAHGPARRAPSRSASVCMGLRLRDSGPVLSGPLAFVARTHHGEQGRPHVSPSSASPYLQDAAVSRLSSCL